MWSNIQLAGRGLAYFAVPMALLGLIALFLVQTYTGNFGRPAFDNAAAREAAAKNVVKALEEDVRQRKARNAGLRNDTINLDLLDERARAELGMIREDEVFLLD